MTRRTASLILLGAPPPADEREEIAQGLAPKAKYFELADRLDGEIMSSADALGRYPGPIDDLVRRDRLFGAAVAAFERRRDFDAIYVTGEDLGMRLAPLLRMSGWRGRLVTVVHACTSTARKAYFRALGPKSFHTLITVCETQRQILIGLGFPPDRVVYCPNWVDTRFFAPSAAKPSGDGDYIFSCGRENRDYASLFAAAAQLPHRFKVTASGFRHDGGGLGEPPPNLALSQSRVSFADLRQNYAGARFVVVPLHAVPYAAGVTGVVEAMSMGKAVITTASPGILDYVQDGVSGRVVPPGDPAALAEAITDLWNDPERCARIGRRNRAWVQANADTDVYVQAVAKLMEPGAVQPVAPAAFLAAE